MDNLIHSKDPANVIFHIGVYRDGSMQDIINVRLPFDNHDLLMRLLNTNRLGGQFYDCYEDGGYFFMFDSSRKRPYPSVMIWKYKIENETRTIVDVEQKDLSIIKYAVKNYLR